MLVPWVDISADPYTEWSSIRAVLAEGIAQNVLDGTRIHEHWIYEIDPSTMLGKITGNMRVLPGHDETGKIHAWTIGSRQAFPIIGTDGETTYIGSQGRTYDLSIIFDIWGFWGDDGSPEIQRAAENEARQLQAFFKRNASQIVATIPGIKRVLPMALTGPQRQPFSDGKNVIVASGTLAVEVSEALTT